MEKHPILFVGAGPGHPDLMTQRGAREVGRAEVLVFAGSLVHPAAVALAPAACERHDSAAMDLQAICAVMRAGHEAGKRVVRLHSGDPAIYGAIGEQIRFLDAHGIPWQVVPGVSSFTASAAAAGVELSLPEVSQTVILTRGVGRTPVPALEQMRGLAAHQATMCVFLSVQLIHKIAEDLLPSYGADCPVAVVYHAGWEDQKVLRSTVGRLEADVKAEKLHKSAMLIVGRVLENKGADSKLYDAGFAHMYRKAAKGA
jgi:precorrin-4/cobalt-precorrin-4 C11-methyltransferase